MGRERTCKVCTETKTGCESTVLTTKPPSRPPNAYRIIQTNTRSVLICVAHAGWRPFPFPGSQCLDHKRWRQECFHMLIVTCPYTFESIWVSYLASFCSSMWATGMWNNGIHHHSFGFWGTNTACNTVYSTVACTDFGEFWLNGT